ncbi:hypothetical protein C8J56DRAFT_890719 [Mycena floridula]|nr:hypothetical protein C8J56DRAFT_890719 [Mycena floridula]
MALPAQLLDSSRFCKGRVDWTVFKEEFELAAEAYGLLPILNGSLAEPTTEPTFTTVVETRDSAGTVTGTTVTIREITTTTPLGSAKPTIADYKVRERRLNHYIMTHIIDSKGIGCDASKHAATNWKLANDILGKVSPVEMVMARERLTGMRLMPAHEDVDEYMNFVRGFKDAHRNAVAAGNKFEDGVLRNMFIEAIDDDHYLEAAGAIPETATLDQTVTILNSTWWVRHRRRLHEIQQAALVTAATVTANAAVANQAIRPRTRTRTRGNRGTGPCSNGNHGPPGDPTSTSALRHDLAHCWEDGGGDVQAAAVTVSDVFVLSSQVQSLEHRIGDVDQRTLADRIDLDNDADMSLIERISDIADNDDNDEYSDMPALEDISDSGSDNSGVPLTQRMNGFGLPR